ncbi:hypothetical protein MKW94_006448 [Papaver nudicaule]|uniref:Uncharacterized protein n=1 Tax=Papaver nudicaule TaxID=74823 RepID=A0AA41V2F9_PAPNU|nr:hypothetical protein [Papaver nudicaule]
MDHSTDSSSSSAASSNGPYRQYHPFQELNLPAEYLYNLPTSPDFLFGEEAMRQRRSMTQNLMYYCGAGYALGAISGALKGSVEGLKSAEAGETIKLRTSRVLSSGQHRGKNYGNTAALIGMYYGTLESWVQSQRDTDDVWNSVAAGLGTGAFYRCVAGPRAAAVAGAFGAVAAGVCVAGEQILQKYFPLEQIVKRIQTPWNHI